LLWSLGDGRNVKFWEDRWVDCKVLKEEFPRLFTISQCKDSEVFDVVDWGQSWSRKCSSWNLSWRRERFEWEKHLEGQLLGLISSVQWNKEGQNRLKWIGDDQQVYTAKSGYSIVNMEDQMSSLECFQLLWSLKIAPSALVWAWRILWDRLPTRVNLVRRGVLLVCTLCPMCQERLENAQHLFCTCKIAQKVWDLCERWIGRVTVRHESIPIHFQSFHLTDHRNSVNKAACKGVWVAVVREIWNLRNTVVFRGGVVDEEEIFCLVQLKGWECLIIGLQELLSLIRIDTLLQSSAWNLCSSFCGPVLD